MGKVTLPRTNQTGTNEWTDVEANDVRIIEEINGNLDSENLKAAAGITAAQLASTAKPVTWYTPTVIATEQTLAAPVAYSKMTTPDEITGIVVPANGLMAITFSAQVKSSVAAAARAALFIGANVMVESSPLLETAFNRVSTTAEGLNRALASATVTTGRINGALQIGELAAGTYAVSVQYAAGAGSVTAKERILRVEVYGY